MVYIVMCNEVEPRCGSCARSETGCLWGQWEEGNDLIMSSRCQQKKSEHIGSRSGDSTLPGPAQDDSREFQAATQISKQVSELSQQPSYIVSALDNNSQVYTRSEYYTLCRTDDQVIAVPEASGTGKISLSGSRHTQADCHLVTEPTQYSSSSDHAAQSESVALTHVDAPDCVLQDDAFYVLYFKVIIFKRLMPLTSRTSADGSKNPDDAMILLSKVYRPVCNLETDKLDARR